MYKGHTKDGKVFEQTHDKQQPDGIPCENLLCSGLMSSNFSPHLKKKQFLSLFEPKGCHMPRSKLSNAPSLLYLYWKVLSLVTSHLSDEAICHLLLSSYSASRQTTPLGCAWQTLCYRPKVWVSPASGRSLSAIFPTGSNDWQHF